MKSKLDELDLSDENAVTYVINDLERDIRRLQSKIDDLENDLENAEKRADTIESKKIFLEKQLIILDTSDLRGGGFGASVHQCLELAHAEARRRFAPNSPEVHCIEGIMNAVL